MLDSLNLTRILIKQKQFMSINRKNKKSKISSFVISANDFQKNCSKNKKNFQTFCVIQLIEIIANNDSK